MTSGEGKRAGTKRLGATSLPLALVRRFGRARFVEMYAVPGSKVLTKDRKYKGVR